jgi:hypothetical protein
LYFPKSFQLRSKIVPTFFQHGAKNRRVSQRAWGIIKKTLNDKITREFPNALGAKLRTTSLTKTNNLWKKVL